MTISFNLAPGHLARPGDRGNPRAGEPQVHLPGDIITNFAGNAQLFQQALAGQGALLLAAVLTIYILLGVLYESYIHPITILSGLPSAGIGALIALEWLHMDLSGHRHHRHPAADRHRQEERDHDGRLRAGAAARGRLDAVTAIREAALVRFRPIIMTTLAALLGSLPIALGVGEGSELRQPLGIAIVGGLCVSAGADALHHAGRLHLSRQGRFLARRPPQGASAAARAQAQSGSRRGGRRMKIQPQAACRNIATTMRSPAPKAALRGGCRSAR